MKGNGQLPVAVFVNICDAIHQLGHLCSATDPIVSGVRDRIADPGTAVMQQCHEQTVAVLEVVSDTRIGHADSAGDGTHLDGVRTGLDKKRLSGFEYQRLRLIGASASSRLTHRHILP